MEGLRDALGQRAARAMLAVLLLPAVLAADTCFPVDYVGLGSPAQPYGQLVDRIAGYLKTDVGTGTILEEWKGDPPVLVQLPPYFYSYAIKPDDTLHVVSYPAFTGAVAIRAFLAYHVYAGDGEMLDRAIGFADWVLCHLTPASDVYGSFPYSTQANGVFGGLADGPAIMLDKAAMFADSLLYLYEVTDDATYLGAATHIADTLAAHQRPDGSWPFRVVPATGVVYRDYTSDQIAFVRLFGHLAALVGDPGGTYQGAADAAWEWILDHPATTLYWNGFYEDVDDPASLVNYDTLETIAELVARAADDPTYDNVAIRLHDWIDDTFLILDPPYAPLIPTIGEQTGFVLGSLLAGTVSSTIQWANVTLDLGRLLGNEAMVTHAIEAANVVTSAQQSAVPGQAEGRMFTVVQDANGENSFPDYWYEQNFIPLWMMIELMGKMPSLAPDDERHLLTATSAVRTVTYGTSIAYTTRGAGLETLKLDTAPAAVTSNGAALPPVADPGAVAQGYRWDAASQVLTVRHLGTAQVISFP